MPTHPLARLGLLAGLSVSLLAFPLAAGAQDATPGAEPQAPTAAESPAADPGGTEPAEAPTDASGAHGEQGTAQSTGTTESHGEGGTVHYPLLKPELLDWSFAGIFGKYDPQQLQRGYNVYVNVCASCHGLEMIAFRNLAEDGGPNFSEEEVQALAAAATIMNPDGSTRPALLSDRLPSPAPTEYNGVIPPDLSLMAKARAVNRGFPWFLIEAFTQYQEGGPNYIHALLTGYQDPPEGVTLAPNTYYNPYFVAAAVISMPPPLTEANLSRVTYPDGTPVTPEQASRDVSAFLMWTAEPHLVARKQMGFQVMIFLAVFAVLMYLTKRKIWHKEHGHAPAAGTSGAAGH